MAKRIKEHPKKIKIILLGSLFNLREKNLDAFKVLAGLTASGFFQEHQTPTQIKEAVDTLIDTVNREVYKDED